jgi:hypothetical protein
MSYKKAVPLGFNKTGFTSNAGINAVNSSILRPSAP